MAATERNTVEYPIHVWIGNNVAKRRTQLGLTQVQLAALVPTGQAYLAHLESARVNCTVEVLWRVARALQTDVATLVSPEAEAARRFERQKPSE